MLTNLDKTPFPYFGGKAQAAPLVWSLLGDVAHYAEPFFGSGAVLLNRPHECNRTYYSESVNDLDGFVVNFWRAVQWAPEATAEAASWPVMELDKSARQIALLRWREAGGRDRLAGDAAYYDPVMAGWWAWAVCAQIGAFDGKSAWTADPKTGVIYKQPLGARGVGVRNNLPHLSNNGQGVNHAGTREPGVSRDRPHLSNDGQGVNHAGTREPGVSRNLPHLSDNGQGVNRPQARVPGVSRDLPHLSDNGQGVNHAGTRVPGVLDPITAAHGQSALDIDWGAAYHNLAMPELIRWFRHLCARLRHVRVLNGDWARLCTSGALQTIVVRQGKGLAGVFLDPPYSAEAERSNSLYAAEDLTIAHDVRAWCLANGDNPRYRIVLAGYDTEHAELERHGWRVHEWFAAGHLRGGYGNINGSNGHQQKRERLWSSPHCLNLDAPAGDEHRQVSFWSEDDEQQAVLGGEDDE